VNEAKPHMTFNDYIERILKPQHDWYIYNHGAQICADGLGALWFWYELNQELLADVQA
jgi:hypothetical protein